MSITGTAIEHHTVAGAGSTRRAHAAEKRRGHWQKTGDPRRGEATARRSHRGDWRARGGRNTSVPSLRPIAYTGAGSPPLHQRSE